MERRCLEANYVGSAILRQMDKHHLIPEVRRELLAQVGQVAQAIGTIDRMKPKQYLEAVDCYEFEKYPGIWG